MTQREKDSDIYTLINSFGIHPGTRNTNNETFQNVIKKYGINKETLEKYLGGFTPYIVNNFINEFVKNINPNSILDPSIGLGFTMREVSETLENKCKITGIEINSDIVELSKKLSNGFPIEYLEGSSIDILQNNDKKYDFIFGDVPRGMRLQGIRGDAGFEIINQSLKHLEDGGYAIFTNPDKFFYSEDSKGLRNNSDYTLVGNIRVSAGSYVGRMVSSNLLIFKKGRSDNIFLGNLNDENAKILAKNFFEGRSNADSRYLNKEDVRSFIWEKQLGFEYINKLVKSGKISLIEGFEIKKCKYNQKIEECFDLGNENSVYIDVAMRHNVYSADEIYKIKDKLEKSPLNYAQVILPEKYNPTIFTAFYNSEDNKKYLDIYGVGGVINRIDTNNIDLYYPNIDEKKALETINKLNNLKNIENSLNSELNSNFIGNIEGISSKLDQIQILNENELLIHNFPTSIRKQFHYYQSEYTAEHYNQAFDFIDHMFLSCSLICLSVLRGGIIYNEELYNKYKDRLIKSVERFDTIGYGDIVHLYYTFITTYEDIFKKADELELITSIYGTNNLSIIENLLKKEIPQLINQFSRLRNNSAHPGATTEEIYKYIIDEKAEPLLKTFISKISSFKNLLIYTCGDGYFDEDENFNAKLTIYKGDNPTVINDIVKGKIIKNKLYFRIADDGNSIPMPCLMKYDKILASDIEQSSYFYSTKDRHTTELQYLTYERIETKKRPYSMEQVKTDPLFDALINKNYRKN